MAGLMIARSTRRSNRLEGPDWGDPGRRRAAKLIDNTAAIEHPAANQAMGRG